MEFLGKTVIVTGAGRGIGRSAALEMARQGASMVICDIDKTGIDAVTKELKAITENVLSFVFDITDEGKVRSMVDDVISELGHIDVLVNNAGIYNNEMGPFVNSASLSWKKKTEVNIYGTLYMTHAVLPHMIAQKYGRIVNLGSVAGVYGITNMVDYSMTKGAIISFTKALAKEVAEFGITVNTVSPGNICVCGIPLPDYSFMNRSGTPEECAEVIVFLSSDRSSFVSGQNYIVDGCRKKM